MAEKSCNVGHNVDGQEETAGCKYPVVKTCACGRSYCAVHAAQLFQGETCDACSKPKLKPR
jgi:hypothetical protein